MTAPVDGGPLSPVPAYPWRVTDGESDQEREERNERIIAAAVKVVAVAVAIGVAIGVGTWVMVKSLGLDDANTSAIGPAPVTPIHPLPTKALPQPHESSSPADGSSGNPSNYPTEIVTPSPGNGVTRTLRRNMSSGFAIFWPFWIAAAGRRT